MTILKIDGSKILMALQGGIEMWVPKAMLKQYGISAKMIKVGAVFPV